MFDEKSDFVSRCGYGSRRGSWRLLHSSTQMISSNMAGKLAHSQTCMDANHGFLGSSPAYRSQNDRRLLDRFWHRTRIIAHICRRLSIHTSNNNQVLQGKRSRMLSFEYNVGLLILHLCLFPGLQSPFTLSTYPAPYHGCSRLGA